jgi:UDP-glucoronosyl and UDP-glucosyl transferase
LGGACAHALIDATTVKPCTATEVSSSSDAGSSIHIPHVGIGVSSPWPAAASTGSAVTTKADSVGGDPLPDRGAVGSVMCAVMCARRTTDEGGQPWHAETVRSLPGNVRVEKFVPYHRLLSYIDVMVTNGGFNGVNAALSHDVPIVVAGATEEKADVAARVAWAGAGLALGNRSMTTQRILRAVNTVLTDARYRAAAARLQEEYRGQDGPQRAAELIEELTTDDHGTAVAAQVTGGEL